MPDPLAEVRKKLAAGNVKPLGKPAYPTEGYATSRSSSPFDRPLANNDYGSFGFGSPRKPAAVAAKPASLEEIRKALKAGTPIAKPVAKPLAKGAHKPPLTHLSGLKTPEQVAQLIESLSGMHPTERMYALYAAGAADARIHDDTDPR